MEKGFRRIRRVTGWLLGVGLVISAWSLGAQTPNVEPDRSTWDYFPDSSLDAHSQAGEPLPPNMFEPNVFPEPVFPQRGGQLHQPLTEPPSADFYFASVSPATEPKSWPFEIQGAARTFLMADERIAWSGMETTFGVEGVLTAHTAHHIAGFVVMLDTEFFLNQPFDRNQLVDTELRRSFQGNFEIEPFEISQLYISIARGDWVLSVGRRVTPFGRFYFPMYRNALDDAPFIRTESILFRETGAILDYTPGIFQFSVGISNGGPEMDANSSKALLARAGIATDWFTLGTSVKWQDGIGSEDQKTYNNHVGLDMLVRSGPVFLSAEVIYDQYGFRRDTFDPLDITWGRSRYGRDSNYAWYQPITGVGYYVDLGCNGDRWLLSVNYGEFYPLQIGDPLHDAPKRRSLLRAVRHFSPHLDLYSTLILENHIPKIMPNTLQKNWALLVGLQYAF